VANDSLNRDKLCMVTDTNQRINLTFNSSSDSVLGGGDGGQLS